MATQLFLKNTSESGVTVSGHTGKKLTTSVGSSFQSFSKTSTAGGNHLNVDDGGQYIWLIQVGAVTISGSITLNFWGNEAFNAVNSQAGVRIVRIDSGGSIVSDVVDNSNGGHTPNSEWTTGATAKNWSATPTSTSFSNGDWLGVIVHGDAIGTMGAGGGINLYYDGTSSIGETYVTFTETIPAYDPNITVTPGVASLSTAVFAATVSVTNNQLVTPDTASLTTATFAPAVSTTQNVLAVPSVATLSLTATDAEVRTDLIGHHTGMIHYDPAQGDPTTYVSVLPDTVESDILLKLTNNAGSDPEGNFRALSRRIDSSTYYLAEVTLNGPSTNFTLQILRSDSGGFTSIGSAVAPAAGWAVGATYWLRFHTSGTSPTTLEARMWLDGDPEPGTWNVSRTNSQSELQTAGGLGIFVTTDSGSDTADIDFDYTATDFLPGNFAQPDTASLTLTTFAPDISASSNQTLVPGVASLTLTTFTPTVDLSNVTAVVPGTAALSLTAFAPSLVLTDHKLVVPGTRALVITAFKPSIVNPIPGTHLDIAISMTALDVDNAAERMTANLSLDEQMTVTLSYE